MENQDKSEKTNTYVLLLKFLDSLPFEQSMLVLDCLTPETQSNIFKIAFNNFRNLPGAIVKTYD